MGWQENVFQIQEQVDALEELGGDTPFNWEMFRVPTVKTTKGLERRMNEQRQKLELFHRVRKYKQQLNRDEERSSWNGKIHYGESAVDEMIQRISELEDGQKNKKKWA